MKEHMVIVECFLKKNKEKKSIYSIQKIVFL